LLTVIFRNYIYNNSLLKRNSNILSREMRKVLIISYDFPPFRTSGIYRPLKFAKHLPQFGWEPIILTAKNPYVDVVDETLLTEIPSGLKVHRAFSIDLAKINDATYKLLFRSNKSDPLKEENLPSKKSNGNTSLFLSMKDWLKRHFFSPLNTFAENWIYIPDSKIGWFPFAFLKAARIVAREKPDVIFSTSAPPTAQLVGLGLKLLFNKPWVTDFRDNWVVGYPKWHYSSDKRVKLDEWLLAKILSRSEKVITMCEGNARDLMEKFDDKREEKYVTITNGYDSDDFSEIDPRTSGQSGGKFILTHIGTLYGGTTGDFFQAVKSAVGESQELQEHLEVRFIGYVDFDYRNQIREQGLSEHIKLIPYMQHPAVIQSMASSDVLLLFLGGHRTALQQFPGKFFEYLYARRVILAIGHPGEVSKVLQRSGCGFLVPHDNRQAIKNALFDLYEKKKTGRLTISPEIAYISRYEYKNLTQKLVETLNEALAVAGRR